ncbi:MAG: rare lipoprotein A [Rhodospirillaceae bacterium]|nr:MAG: rare lipoprotein A [Rhodospirillaceae bacterium]
MDGNSWTVRTWVRKMGWGILCLVPMACAAPQPVTAPPVVERERPPVRGLYKVGEPYQIKGIWYYPHEDYDYRETGVASWYGMDFHKKETANGEIFDMNAITAAHRTLPMPSVVRVTNLVNGRALAVRVNDRGPFVNDRILDLSRQAAQLLGFAAQGVTQVKVEILAEESITLKSQLLRDSTLIAGPKIDAAPQVAVVTEPLAPLSVMKLPVPSSPGTKALSGQGAAPGAKTLAEPLEKPVTKPVTKPLDKPGAKPSPAAKSIVPAAKPIVKPIAKPSEKPGAKPLEQPAAVSGYYIQVATFGNSAFAERASRHLKAKGRVSVLQQGTGDRVLYRVRIGPLAGVPEAERLLADVRKAGYADARIVRGE